MNPHITLDHPIWYIRDMGYREELKNIFGAALIDKLNNYDAYRKGWDQHRNEFIESNNARKCFIVGSANYANLGDLAISEAQRKFLDDYFDGSIIEIQTDHFWEYARCMKAFIRPNDIICFQGGGNMGDLYSWFEYERCAVMQIFPDNRFIVMPQTISYSSDSSHVLKYSKKVYSRQKDLHLFAREAKSQHIMQETYPSATIGLVPDIVLSLDASSYVRYSERNGLTLMLRNDKERALTDEDQSIIQTMAQRTGLKISQKDTVSYDNSKEVSIPERRHYLEDMLQTFADSAVVITDRLHGMIFATITHTPCVVLSNSNHKIAGVYQWIKDVPYIKFVHSAKDVESAAQTVMNADTEYSRERLLARFQPLIEALE